MLRTFLILPRANNHVLFVLVTISLLSSVREPEEAVRNKYLAIFAICLAAVTVLAWYQSLPHPNGGPTSPTAHWTEYLLTKNGNHTQLQASYSDGQTSTTEQILWLNFDNRTAVYNYFGCTPSMPGCTLDACSFTVLNDTASEYRVRVYCAPGA